MKKYLFLIISLILITSNAFCASKKLGTDSSLSFISQPKVRWECKSNSDCTTNLCIDKKCVQCTTDSQCASAWGNSLYTCNKEKNKIARQGVCISGVRCNTDSDCKNGKRCNPSSGECVGCINDSQCATLDKPGRFCSSDTHQCSTCKQGESCGTCIGNYVANGNGGCMCAADSFDFNKGSGSLDCRKLSDFCHCKESGQHAEANGSNGCCCVNN